MTNARSAVFALAIGALTLASCVDERGPAGEDAALSAVVDAELLDARADGALLLGPVEPAPPASDADRVLVLSTEDAGAARVLDGARVLDARFADGGVVVLFADHVLAFVDARGARVALDEEVYAPLSIAGDRVAYVRGSPPDLELARASVRTAESEQLTHGMAPVWSPALSEDGSEIVFVSGASGAPRLHRVDASGQIEALAPTERTPSSPRAPRWIGSTLVFEDEAGVATIELSTGAIVADAPGAHGLTAIVGAR